MRTKRLANFRRRSSLVLGLTAFTGLLLLPAHEMRSARADEGAYIMRIEQDWQLVLNEPGAEVNAPQFHTVISPNGGLNNGYAQVSWNYRELPDFTSGGLQVQMWSGDGDPQLTSVGEGVLSTNAETITWTQRLTTDGTQLTFAIINGHSTSWGAFGGDAMTASLPLSHPNLNQYSTSVTQTNSWITFGANRVNSLVITQVRYYNTDGLVRTDSTPVVIYHSDTNQQAGG